MKRTIFALAAVVLTISTSKPGIPAGRHLSFIPRALACLTCAVVAPAVGEQAATEQAAPDQPMTAEATLLEGDYVALGVRIAACPQGACADAAAIRIDLSALEVRRAALAPSSAAIDLLAGTLSATVTGWEEQS